jgi:hypothetical protein
MLSINGSTFGEVFANIAKDTASYDEGERSAARAIAEWMDREEAQKAVRAQYHPIQDRAAYAEADKEFSRISKERPYVVPEGRGFGPEEFSTFVCGGFRFTVYPYTTGNTMNVGVDPA